MRIPLTHASTKIRTGPPVDEEEDYGWPVWAGVVPVTTVLGQPQADPRLAEGIELPQNVAALADTTR